MRLLKHMRARDNRATLRTHRLQVGVRGPRANTQPGPEAKSPTMSSISLAGGGGVGGGGGGAVTSV